MPQELEIEKINAITRNLKEGDQEDKEFERRMRVAETLIKREATQGKTNANRQGTPTPIQPVQQPANRQMATPRPAGETDRGIE